MRQLTTGCTCRGIDTGSQFAWISRGCAMHSPELAHLKLRPTRPDPPMRACCCLYGVRKVEGAPGPYGLVNMTDRYRRRSWGVWAFKIHPRCPHHGDYRRAEAVIATARELGIDLLPWQENAIRSMYHGTLVSRPRRVGMETVRKAVAAYEELHPTMAVFDEWPAWETLDDTERRGD